MTGDEVSDAPGDSDDEWAVGLSCGNCGRGAAAWLHLIDTDRARFRVYGKSSSFPHEVYRCERCERLYRAGDDEGLVAAHPRTWETTPEDVEQAIRRPLAVLRAAELGVVEVARTLPAGVAELAAEGFAPVEYLSGGIDVPRTWPEQHRRSVPETRPGTRDDTGLMWLIRSPWPTVPVVTAVSLMWCWVERTDPAAPGAGFDAASRLSRSLDFLARDEAWVLGYQRSVG